MKRTIIPESIIPDAINCSASKDYTCISNTILRNPVLSFKAKGILSLLLSNKQGWKSHLKALETLSKDKLDGIRSGLQELEQEGYLIRIKYRDKISKRWCGSFWAYTDIPHHFNLQNTLTTLDNKGFEPEPEKPYMEKPYMEKPYMEKPYMENPMLIILNNNKTKSNNTNNTGVEEIIPPKKENITIGMFEQFWTLFPKKVDKGKTLSKWKQICSHPPDQRPTWKQIKRAILQQKKTDRWQRGYIPHPTTWLNQNRWLDDPKEMISFDQEKNNNKPEKILAYGEYYFLNKENGEYYNRDGKIYM